MADILSARATRLGIRLVRPLSCLPPEIQVPGDKPNQEQNCLADAKRPRCGPSEPVLNFVCEAYHDR